MTNTFNRGHTMTQRSRRRRLPYRLMINEVQHVVLVDNGRISAVLPTGVTWIKPWCHQAITIDARPWVLHVPGQEILTSDGATVRASVAAVVSVEDPLEFARSGLKTETLHLAIQLGLRAAIGARDLASTLADRDEAGAELFAAALPAAQTLGLTLSEVAIRDLNVSGELKRAVAEVITAKLSGQAALERARGEAAALRSLANTARLARDTPELLQLRLIQQMETSTGNTYVLASNNGVPTLTANP